MVIIKRKPIILCDLDDVLHPLCPIWIETLNNMYSLNHNMQEMSSTGWAISKLFVELTNEQILFPLKNNEFWSNVNVSNEGYSFLDWLKTHEYQFKIVTASFFESVSSKIKHFLNQTKGIVTQDDIIITMDKSYITGDILIDDAPKHMRKGCYKKLLIDMPFNRDFDESKVKNCKRIKSLHFAIPEIQCWENQ